MHLKNLIATISATIVLLAGSAVAQTTNYQVESFRQTIDGTEWVVNDIRIDFNDQYAGSQMLMSLNTGSAYMHSSASPAAASQGIVDLAPDIVYSTAGVQGALPTDGSPAQTPGTGGGALNLGGNSVPTFDSTLIDQAWNPPGGAAIVDQQGFHVARVTLSPDASGEFTFASYAGPGDPADAMLFQTPIIGGQLIPEPSTMVLLGLGLIGLVALKRRNG